MPSPTELVQAANSIKIYANKLAKAGKGAEAEKFLNERDDLLNLGAALEPLVDGIKKIEKVMKTASPEEQEVLQIELDILQKEAETLMQNLRLPGGGFNSNP